VSNHPQRRGEVVQSASSDGWTVYVSETDSLHVLNDSARAIWELCDGRTTIDEMVVAIALLTGIPEKTARQDVTTALSELSTLGLITDSPMED
jgi:hypothetical protein